MLSPAAPGPARSGVCRVQWYIDGPRGVGQPGWGGNPNATNGVEIGSRTGGFPPTTISGGPGGIGGPVWQLGHPPGLFPHPPDQYGPQYSTASWVAFFQPQNLSLGKHSIYVYAQSCGVPQPSVIINGVQLFPPPLQKETQSSFTFNIVSQGPRNP